MVNTDIQRVNHIIRTWFSDHIRLITLVGFITLAIPAGILVFLAIVGAGLVAHTWVIAFLMASICLVTIRGMYFEWHAVIRAPRIEAVSDHRMVGIMLGIVGGTLVTFGLSVEFGIHPIVAASMTGVVAAIVLARLAVPIYCGAFVGMTAPLLFPTYGHSVIAGVIAVLVYLIAQPVFYGVGGKLGTTAFVGTTATVALTAGEFFVEPVPDLGPILLIIGYSTVAAPLTFALHVRLPFHPVFASGIVGGAAGLGLPILYGEPGLLIAASVYAASFAGMASSSRVPNEGWMLICGVIVGLLFVYTMPYLGGSGGKLGTIGFIACLAMYGTLGSVRVIRIKQHIARKPHRDIS